MWRLVPHSDRYHRYHNSKGGQFSSRLHPCLCFFVSFDAQYKSEHSSFPKNKVPSIAKSSAHPAPQPRIPLAHSWKRQAPESLNGEMIPLRWWNESCMWYQWLWGCWGVGTFFFFESYQNPGIVADICYLKDGIQWWVLRGPIFGECYSCFRVCRKQECRSMIERDESV
jgi:hypothetical protein